MVHWFKRWLVAVCLADWWDDLLASWLNVVCVSLLLLLLLLFCCSKTEAFEECKNLVPMTLPAIRKCSKDTEPIQNDLHFVVFFVCCFRCCMCFHHIHSPCLGPASHSWDAISESFILCVLLRLLGVCGRFLKSNQTINNNNSNKTEFLLMFCCCSCRIVFLLLMLLLLLLLLLKSVLLFLILCCLLVLLVARSQIK